MNHVLLLVRYRSQNGLRGSFTGTRSQNDLRESFTGTRLNELHYWNLPRRSSHPMPPDCQGLLSLIFKHTLEMNPLKGAITRPKERTQYMRGVEPELRDRLRTYYYWDSLVDDTIFMRSRRKSIFWGYRSICPCRGITS
jgi:hypothetical protein